MRSSAMRKSAIIQRHTDVTSQHAIGVKSLRQYHDERSLVFEKYSFSSGLNKSKTSKRSAFPWEAWIHGQKCITIDKAAFRVKLKNRKTNMIQASQFKIPVDWSTIDEQHLSPEKMRWRYTETNNLQFRNSKNAKTLGNSKINKTGHTPRQY